MLEPSSSEEESDGNEPVEEENAEVSGLSTASTVTLEIPRSGSIPRSISPASGVGETLSVGSGNHSRSNSLARDRPASPSPSVASEKEKDDLEKEEEERKRRLQLYVFVLRSTAYPFNAKQPTDMTRRQIKVTKQQLETFHLRFQVIINFVFQSSNLLFCYIYLISFIRKNYNTSAQWQRQLDGCFYIYKKSK